MSTFHEMSELPERYQRYARELREIFEKHEVRSARDLARLREGAARQDVDRWVRNLRDQDGAKLGLGSIGVIVGAALGGVGIAAFGGAVGLPLAAVLGAAGFLGGSGVDARGWIGGEFRGRWLKLPRRLDDRIRAEALISGVKPNDVIVAHLVAALRETSDDAQPLIKDTTRGTPDDP